MQIYEDISALSNSTSYGGLSIFAAFATKGNAGPECTYMPGYVNTFMALTGAFTMFNMASKPYIDALANQFYITKYKFYPASFTYDYDSNIGGHGTNLTNDTVRLNRSCTMSWKFPKGKLLKYNVNTQSLPDAWNPTIYFVNSGNTKFFVQYQRFVSFTDV